MLSNIAGLPAHPFFVHGAVVLIPLTALVVIAWVFVPRWRTLLRVPAVLGAVVSAVVIVVTRESGDALAQGRDLGTHETYADAFTIATGAMILLIIVLVWLARRGGRAEQSDRADQWRGGLGWVTCILAAVVAVTVLVTAGLTGHSGASLVGKANPQAANRPPANRSANKATATRASRWNLLPR